MAALDPAAALPRLTPDFINHVGPSGVLHCSKVVRVGVILTVGQGYSVGATVKKRSN